MARPILFSSVSREKFDNIPEEDKKKKNYQIKEEDGTVSKYISNLEGGTSGGFPIIEPIYSSVTTTDDQEKYTWHFDKSQIDNAFNNNKGFQTHLEYTTGSQREPGETKEYCLYTLQSKDLSDSSNIYTFYIDNKNANDYLCDYDDETGKVDYYITTRYGRYLT